MVRIRLSRIGAKKRPFYRVVVTDSTRARGGRSKEVIGTYDPLTDLPVRLDSERALYWLSVGAQPTDTVKYLLEEQGIWAAFMKAKGKEYTPKPKSEPVATPVAAPAPQPEPAVEEVVAQSAPEESVAESTGDEPSPETSAEAEPQVAEAAAAEPAAEEGEEQS
ncbi:MAG: hypothetical protein AMXMBFR61_10030 [Fimbriimonadales bacterium]